MREKTGPRIRFSRLSEPGSKTTSNRSSFLSIPFSVKSSAFLWAAPARRTRLSLPASPGPGEPFLGLYPPLGAAQAAFERLERHAVTGLVTRTLPRGDYWRTMMGAYGPSRAIARRTTLGDRLIVGKL